MEKELEDMLNDPSKENMLDFLDFIKQKYKTTDLSRKDLFLEELKYGITNLIFFTIDLFKKELGERTNCFFIETKANYLLICFYLLGIDKKNFLSRLEKITNMVEDDWLEKASVFLENDVIEKIIAIADEKYDLFKVLENSKNLYFFFTIPYVNKYAETHSVSINFDGFEILFHELFGLEKNLFRLEYSFSYLLGLSLYHYVCQKNKKVLDEFKLSFSVEEKNLKDFFAEAFSAALLRYTEYEEDVLNPELVDKFISFFESNIKKLHKKREISVNQLCPCGSEKKYGDCCKLKKIKWIKENGELSKEINLVPEAINLISQYMEKYEKVLGRKIYGYEKLWNLLPISEAMNPYEHFFSLLIDDDFDLSLQYAALKTDRLISEKNIDTIPDIELDEWQEAIDEFNEKNSIKIKNGKSIYELVKDANKALKNLPEKISNCILALNIFIDKITDLYFLYTDFKISNQQDFAIVCARKVFKDGEILKKGIEAKSVEEVTNITRILFEDLIQTEVFLKNHDLFKEKILALSLLESGEAYYKETSLGVTSRNLVISKKTKEQFNTKIIMKDLSEKSENYKEFYDRCFDGLSSFIHLNIAKIPSYFRIQNPLTEVNESRVTGLLGLFFINQCVYEIKNNLKLDKLLVRDMEYLYTQTSEFILECIKLINLVEENNELLDNLNKIIEKCLKNNVNIF